MKRGWRITREISLTLGAVLGVLSITAALAAAFFGITPLIFRSGSMAPTIETGALALAQNVTASEIRVNDIVSAFAPDGARVTHRVESAQMQADGSVSLVMRGDANEITDAEPYVVQSADRILWHMNGLGFVLQEAQKPIYIFAIGVFVGGMLSLSLWPRRLAESGQPTIQGAGDIADEAIRRKNAGDGDGTETGKGSGEQGDGEVGVDTVSPPVPAGRWAARATAICIVPLLGAVLVGPASGTVASFTTTATASRQLAVPTRLQPSAVTCAFTPDDEPAPTSAEPADPAQTDPAAPTADAESAPTAPEMAALPAPRSGTLDVTWVAPAAGAPEFGYLATVHLTETPQPGDPTVATDDPGVALVTHLTPGRSYYLTIAAVPFENWHASIRTLLIVEGDGGASCT